MCAAESREAGGRRGGPQRSEGAHADGFKGDSAQSPVSQDTQDDLASHVSSSWTSLWRPDLFSLSFPCARFG